VSCNTIPDDFRGQNTEAPPLPVGSRFSQFGTVSDWTHLQELSPLSWLSFSQPPDLPTVPGLVKSGLAGRPAQYSPRKPRLNGHRIDCPVARTPWAGFWLANATAVRRNALSGAATPSRSVHKRAPALCQDSLDRILSRFVHVARIQRTDLRIGSNVGITPMRILGYKSSICRLGISPTSLRRAG